MKKILYAFIILLILLIAAVFTAVNSSYVINKVAQKFAPDYNLSYDHISGNVFTGIKIDKLKYADKAIANDITYRWDPLTLFQKKITIDEIKIENADIETIKALIASFDVDECDDNSSGSFDFDVEVENVSVSLDHFTQEGIAFNKVVLKADNIDYLSDGKIEVDDLLLDVDTNLTKLLLKANMKKGELYVDDLSIKALDSLMLESIIAKFTDNNASKETKTNSDEPLNPMIPKIVNLKHFSGSVKPREYMSIDIGLLNVDIKDLKIDISKIMENRRNSINVGDLSLKLDTNITRIDLQASLNEDEAVLEHLTLKNIDTLALQQLFAGDNNESKSSTEDEPNIFIPKKVMIKQLQADLLPAEYPPVKIETAMLLGENIDLDVEKLVLKKGTLDLNGTTNLSNIILNGEVQENHFAGEVRLTPNKPLFEFYDLPLRREAIGTIIVDLNASKELIVADVKAKAKDLLQGKEGDFNVDINTLHSHVKYAVENNRLEVDSSATVTTPYAKDIQVTNTFLMDNNISYHGEVKAPKLSGVDAHVIKPLQDLLITYSGDKSGIRTKLNSKQLKGNFVLDEKNRGVLHLETLEALNVSEFAELPETLKDAKVNVIADVPIDLNNTDSFAGKIKITSNLADVDADVVYGKTVKLKAKTIIPKNSLLKSFNKDVKWDALTPMDITFDMSDNDMVANISTKAVRSDLKYLTKSKQVNANIKLGGLIMTIRGATDKIVKIDTKISSMGSLEKSIAMLYNMEDFPPLEGGAKLSATVTKMQRLDVVLNSPKLTYKVDRKTKHVISDVKLKASMESSKAVLDAYSFTYDKEKFFSTKPSRVNIDGDIITLESLWLNDALDVKGAYNTKTRTGLITAKADKLPVRHEYVDLDAMVNLKAKLDGNSTFIDGKITLLGGEIKYDISKKTFARDSDIIIVQEMKKEKDGPFMDNLSTNILVKAKKPLVLKQGAIDVKLELDLGINKVQHGPLMILGSIELLKGGSYIFEGKRFVIKKGFIHFTGNPNKPLLEIKVKYRSINHLVTIDVSGTPDAPHINFSSSPSLNREQILSLILFDTEEGGDTHSGDEMMRMMGGAMAKSALSDMGIKLDHLVLGEGNSVEVGKKLTNKITIIYVNGEVSRVKLKYQHSRRTESVIQMSEESQSYDIIFKDDF